jgi:hypothetical protein
VAGQGDAGAVVESFWQLTVLGKANQICCHWGYEVFI